MNKEQELAKNTIILTIGKICTQFVSFLLLPLYTALLVPEEFGTVDLLNTYVALLVPIFNWQFENGMFRFMLECRTRYDEQKKIFSTVLCVNVCQIAVYLCFYFILQNFIVLPYKNFLAIDVSLNILLNTLLQLPRSLGDNTRYAIGSFISATSAVMMNALFIAFFKLGVMGMFCATILSKILTIFYLFCGTKAWKYFNLSSFDISIFSQISKYSLPLVPNQLSWWVIGASDRTIISWFINVAANGIYSVANKFSSLFITFYNIFHLAWTESVSLHIDDTDSEEFITEVINSILKLFIAICFGFILVMSLVFPLFVDVQYKNAYQQIPILMLAVLFQIVVGLYSVVYTALKKSVEIMKTSIYAAIINVIVDVCLIRYIGLYAASISTMVAYLIMAIYRYFHVKQFLNIKIKRETICSGVVLGSIAIIAYYSGTVIVRVVSLAFVLICFGILNKSILLALFKSVLDVMNKLRK